jgi:hypothetical protein
MVGMRVLQLYLLAVLAVNIIYTIIVGVNHGWNLFEVFFSNVAAVNWDGQFNVDFMSFLSLSGLWVSWRHGFSVGAIALGLVAFFGGILFLAPYLLWASWNAKGDVMTMLLGKRLPRPADVAK